MRPVLARKRILVVDDHPINLKLACDVMEHEGYQVDRASAADTALACLEQRLPDLILMDLGMPGMDGLALTRHLRSQERTRKVPVVALTAFAMRQDRERTLAAGFDGYLEKPINIRAFPEQVRDFLREGDQ